MRPATPTPLYALQDPTLYRCTRSTYGYFLHYIGSSLHYIWFQPLSRLAPHSTLYTPQVHEKIELLHKLFPPLMHGARMISGVIYRDVTLYNKMLVEQALQPLRPFATAP